MTNPGGLSRARSSGRGRVVRGLAGESSERGPRATQRLARQEQRIVAPFVVPG